MANYNKTKAGANAASLQSEINANGNIAKNCVGITYTDPNLIIEFDAALSAAEETELDTVVIPAHTGTPPNFQSVGKSTLVLQDEKSVVSSGVFEKVWGIRSNPAVLAADEGSTLDKTFAQILGEVRCDATGGDPKFRIQEDGVDIVASTSIADTSGSWVEFVAYIPVGVLSALRHRYTFDARLNGGTSLEFRETSLTLLHNSV